MEWLESCKQWLGEKSGTTAREGVQHFIAALKSHNSPLNPRKE